MMSNTQPPRKGRTVLYYPTIDIPTSGPWIRSALLYWDNLASIVPRSYDDMRDEQAMARYGADLRCLYEDRVFWPVNPDLLMQDFDEVRRFEKEVIAHVSRQRKLILTKPKCTERIFKQKLSQHLFQELERLGMAEERGKTREDYFCYFFHPKAADIYMALLADYLAPKDSKLTIPGTDQISAFEATFECARKKQDLSVAAKLFEILPQPSGEVSLRKILKFREKYRAELLAFRAEMDSFENALRKAEDTKSMGSVVVRSQERIEKECSDLAKALKGSAIQTFLGSIQIFLRAPSPYVIAAGSVLLNKATEVAKVPVEYTIAGALAGGAIEVTVQYLKQRRERITSVHQSPFAYLFLKQRKLR